MSKKVTINQRVGEFAVGTSLFEAGEDLDISVPSSCRKQGKCSECLMEITTGMESLTPPTDEEAHLKDNFRLSCCARISETPGEVQAHTMRRAEIHIEDEAMNLPPEAALEKIDPTVTRDGDRVLLDGKEIAKSTGPLVGLAIDIGTTTVVIRALDLESGEIIASTSLENPQRFGGTDVMSRIQFDTDHKGRLLHRTLLGYLTRAIKQLPVEPDSIYEIVVAGNPTMRDLFLGLDVSSIGQRPYRCLSEKAWRDGKANTTAVSMPARKLRLPCPPEARLYAMPPPVYSPWRATVATNSSQSWISAPTRKCSWATAINYWPLPARRGRRSKAAPSAKACRASMVPSRKFVLRTMEMWKSGLLATRPPRAFVDPD